MADIALWYASYGAINAWLKAGEAGWKAIGAPAGATVTEVMAVRVTAADVAEAIGQHEVAKTLAEAARIAHDLAHKKDIAAARAQGEASAKLETAFQRWKRAWDGYTLCLEASKFAEYEGSRQE